MRGSAGRRPTAPTRSAGRSSSLASGRPVEVAVDVPRLELDRPFTYLLPDGEEAPTGTLVSVPFHGRTVRGWVLGPAEDLPARMLPIRRVLSRVPLFQEEDLRLYRWMGERYVAPLASVIRRAHPPRVASEERGRGGVAAQVPPLRAPSVLERYRGGAELVEACRAGAGAFLVRPLPDHEAGACLQAVAACLRGGRSAVVVVPEAEPLPETARLIAERVGEAALVFVGGEARVRYRGWVDALRGRYRVVIGTRSAVFAPVPNLGLIWVHREAHPGHREERSPYHNVREVALARAHLRGAVCVLAGLCPSAEAVSLATVGRAAVVRAARAAEREAAPLVETIRPEGEVPPALARRVRASEGGFLLVGRRGYGAARACRRCGEPALCGRCSGRVSIRGGGPVCETCGADAPCTACGGRMFAVDRGGTERVEEWVRRLTGSPVRRVDERDDAVAPGAGRVVVATAAGVKDFGPLRVGLVAILDADRSLRRPGISAAEQALATWMEAAAWVGPRRSGGRVVLVTQEPADPAVQALVRWDPWHFHEREGRRRAEAGFPPGFPVFRVRGGPGASEALRALRPVAQLSSETDGETVSLVTLAPEAVPEFRAWVIERLAGGEVTRVEAEPQP